MAAATNAAAGEAAGDSNQRRTDGVGQYRAHDQAFEVIDPFINGLSPFRVHAGSPAREAA
jgi:hypothetical protein